MASFVVPIWDRVFDPDPDGPIRRYFQARVPATVERRPGQFVQVPFVVVDTGASFTVMTATLARSYGLELPAATSRLTINTASGSRPSRVRDGELRLRFAALPGRVFRLYCLFSEDVPPSVPPLLGLNDTLDVFRLTFDGTPGPAGPFGSLRFETTA
jgi:hypothetical protein